MGLFTKRSRPGLDIRALTAAAQQIALGDGEELKRLAKLRQQWQTKAFDVYDTVGEVWYLANFYGFSFSKVDLFAGEFNDEGKIVPTENEAVIAQMERLKSADGTYSDLMRPYGLNLWLTGDCQLVGLDAKNDGDEEEWDIYSIEEVKLTAEGKLKIDDRELAEGKDFFTRLWVSSPRKRKYADSSVKAVLEVCDEILLLSRAKRAVALNRAISSGLLYVHEKLSEDAPDPTQDEGDGNAISTDPFLKDLLEHMTTPIKDPNSAAGVVPMLVRGGLPPDEAIKHFPIDRPLDQHLQMWLKDAIDRLAQGLFAPPEVIRGMATGNHWSAWLIDDQAYKNHLEPYLTLAASGLTEGFLRPMLKAGDIADPKNYVVWFDPANLVVRPNRVEDAKDLHTSEVISDEALRREANFPETDAPSDEEIRRRRGRSASPGSEGEPEDDPLPETDPDDDPDASARALTAAAAGSNLGRRLFDMDRVLRDRLSVAADAAMRRALDRVGARLRSRTTKDATLRAAVSQVPNPLVASALGATLVSSLGRTDDELLEGSFDDLGSQFSTWVADVQARGLKLVPAVTAAERTATSNQQEEDRAGAWEWFRSALMELARERLYDPDPDAPEVGEYDPSLIVPVGIVREAVARAGGAAGPSASVTAGLVERLLSAELNVLGVATGWLLKEMFARREVLVEGYEWVYGAYPRQRPFEPHAALDGLEFENFDDPRLRNFESWPATEFYLPGDHPGCSCDFMPTMVERGA